MPIAPVLRSPRHAVVSRLLMCPPHIIWRRHGAPFWELFDDQSRGPSSPGAAVVRGSAARFAPASLKFVAPSMAALFAACRSSAKSATVNSEKGRVVHGRRFQTTASKRGFDSDVSPMFLRHAALSQASLRPAPSVEAIVHIVWYRS